MEFMEVQHQEVEKKKHNKDEALNLFRYAIRNQLAQLEKLLIAQKYDRVQMLVDYICEGQIDKLFKVIEQHFKEEGAKGSIMIQKNDKGQNLIHVMARNGHLIKDIGQLSKLYKQMVEEGVNPKEVDCKGRTALHLAVRSGNLHLIKFLIDVEGFAVNEQDKRGANAICTLLKGDRILKAAPNLLEVLIKAGGDPNALYGESMYQSAQHPHYQEERKEGDRYRTTCVIHAIRHESKNRDNIKNILKILLQHANFGLQDSDGRDAFMYTAIRNHMNTFNFILDVLKEHAQDQALFRRDNVDIFGKSVVHYIVNPLPYGSYENVSMLKKAVEVGFKHDIPDREGRTPYYYACQQKSGLMKAAFIELNIAGEEPNAAMEIDYLIGGMGQAP